MTLKLKAVELSKLHKVEVDGTKKRCEQLVEWLNGSAMKRKYRFYVEKDPKNEGLFGVNVSGMTQTVRANHNAFKGDYLLCNFDYKTVEVVCPTGKVVYGEKPDTRPPLNEFQLRYVNHVAPEHCRTSCSDDSLYNAWYGKDDSYMGRCTRCTLLKAALGSLPDDEDED